MADFFHVPETDFMRPALQYISSPVMLPRYVNPPDIRLLTRKSACRTLLPFSQHHYNTIKYNSSSVDEFFCGNPFYIWHSANFYFKRGNFRSESERSTPRIHLNSGRNSHFRDAASQIVSQLGSHV